MLQFKILQRIYHFETNSLAHINFLELFWFEKVIRVKVISARY